MAPLRENTSAFAGDSAGDYEGHVMTSSLYTKSLIRPVVAGGFIVAGLGLA